MSLITHVHELISGDGLSFDAEIWAGNPDANFGTALTFRTTEVPNAFRSLLHIDLSAYIGRVITAGSLVLTNAAASSNAILKIHRVTQTAWNEGAVSWNKYDSANSWISAGGDFDPTPAQTLGPFSAAPGSTVTFNNLVALIQDALDNRSGHLHAILMWTNDTTNVGTFHSSEASASRPSLQFSYEITDPANQLILTQSAVSQLISSEVPGGSEWRPRMVIRRRMKVKNPFTFHP